MSLGKVKVRALATFCSFYSMLTRDRERKEGLSRLSASLRDALEGL